MTDSRSFKGHLVGGKLLGWDFPAGQLGQIAADLFPQTVRYRLLGCNLLPDLLLLLLKLLKVGNVGVLEAFRTFIYDGQVNGVSDGIQIVAHDSTTKGMLDSKRYTGAVD